MSTDQPPPGQPPEDDPFLKRPQDPTPPQTPPGSPGAGSPYGSPSGAGGAEGYPPPPPGGSGGGGYPPPPPGGSGGDGYPPPPPPYGGGGDPYGGGAGGAGAGGPYGGGPYGGGGYGAPDPLAGMPPLADFGKRLLARIIDALLIGIPLGVLQWLTSRNRFTIETDNGEDATEVFTKAYSGGGLLWTIIGVLAFVGYDWYMTKSTGQTVGKRLMHLRVAMLNDGSVPASNAALSRAAVLWIPTLLCCACLWPLVLIITILSDKPYRQGLHDKVGKTVVVTAP
ncbi:RDD family protein [Streptomyces sp. NPDC097619]|uniref:RDD family protein n=1 Tax=Streptomyces sp. NPDC097619 TaxID=3157228 RepID=UPI00332FBE3B